MKILFAIQGTGNGHLSRAREVYPELAKYGEVDVLISGIQADVSFPYPVKYKFYGLSFIFGKKGGVSIWETARKLKLFRLLRDIDSLPVREYDLVVNDFEPVSAWACKWRHVPCISLSHQCAVADAKSPKPKFSDPMGSAVLANYAPTTDAYGFHFKKYAFNIFTPVIRSEVRKAVVSDEGHYTVYLPSYDDETLIKHLSHFEHARWKVFSKHNKEAFSFKNIEIEPIENDAFIRSMASATGVLCGAGFEGPAEALFLGKKLLTIPMHMQYEQHCNAAALEQLGVPVIQKLDPKYYEFIKNWIHYDQRVSVHYPDQTADIVRHIVQVHAVKRSNPLQRVTA